MKCRDCGNNYDEWVKDYTNDEDDIVSFYGLCEDCGTLHDPCPEI